MAGTLRSGICAIGKLWVVERGRRAKRRAIGPPNAAVFTDRSAGNWKVGISEGGTPRRTRRYPVFGKGVPSGRDQIPASSTRRRNASRRANVVQFRHPALRIPEALRADARPARRTDELLPRAEDHLYVHSVQPQGCRGDARAGFKRFQDRSEEHTSELQSLRHLV